MGKVYSFSQIKNRSKNKNASLEYEGIMEYGDLLEIQRDLLEELYIETESFLKEFNFPIATFRLDEKSAREYVSSDLYKVFHEGVDSLRISYIGFIDGIEYRTLAEAQIDGESVEVTVSIYKKDGNTWLIGVDQDTWEEGPGEDFF